MMLSGVQGVLQILQHVERHLQRHQLEAQLSTDEASYRATYDVRLVSLACRMLLPARLMDGCFQQPHCIAFKCAYRKTGILYVEVRFVIPATDCRPLRCSASMTPARVGLQPVSLAVNAPQG